MTLNRIDFFVLNCKREENEVIQQLNRMHKKLTKLWAKMEMQQAKIFRNAHAIKYMK